MKNIVGLGGGNIGAASNPGEEEAVNTTLGVCVEECLLEGGQK